MSPESGVRSQSLVVVVSREDARVQRWSRWRAFPDPRRCGVLVAPVGPGLYHIRNRRTGRNILFGRAANVAARMSSLLPRPHGCGGRNNSRKRLYVLRNLRDLEYRALACATKGEEVAAERELKRRHDDWLYGT